MEKYKKKISLYVRLRRHFKCLKEEATIFGWRKTIWRDIKYYPVFKQLSDLKWWIAYRTYRKFHVLNLGTKPGYSDVTERLIYANFVLLKDYVEKEEPFDRIDWAGDPASVHAAKEIKELYDWWINVFPKKDELDPLFTVDCPGFKTKEIAFDEDGDPTLFEMVSGETEADKAFSEACKKSHEFEEKWDKTVEENLIRLAKIRQYLWT